MWRTSLIDDSILIGKGAVPSRLAYLHMASSPVSCVPIYSSPDDQNSRISGARKEVLFWGPSVSTFKPV